MRQQARALYALRPALRALLRSCGVRGADIDDVVQEVLCGAWRSMQAGRYHPSPAMSPAEALARWLYGIAWRHASHYRESAWVRRVVLAPKPPGDSAPSHEARFDAWEALQLLDCIPRWAAEVLVLHYAEKYEPRELAEASGVGMNTIYTRLRLARQHFERRSRARAG